MASSSISSRALLVAPPAHDLLLSSHKYDILLAAAARPGTGAEARWPLYDGIAEIVGKLGKEAFLPHRDADIRKIREKELGELMQRIIAKKVDLVLYYAGIGSLAARIALITACDREIPITFFYEHHNHGLYDATVRNLELPERTEQIVFETEAEALAIMEDSLRRFYQGAVH